MEILSLSDVAAGRQAAAAASIGRKAWSLVELIRAGFPVPGGYVIPAETCASLRHGADVSTLLEALRGVLPTDKDTIVERLSEIRRAIRAVELPAALVEELSQNLSAGADSAAWAIRSSGVKEDLAEASFAGLYTTVLGARGLGDIGAAIKHCVASLYNTRVYAYCADKGIDFDDVELAVIVQSLVQADKSGVVFTVDPVRGNDTQMMIEACMGLGDALVGGEVTPDTYVYDWRKPRVVSKNVGGNPEGGEPAHPVLGDEELALICELALRVQVLYGFPVDIEWVQRDGVFQLVQARPITTIRQAGIEGQWTTADFKDGGVSSAVCSPLMWSLYDFIWEEAMPSYLLATKLLDEDKDTLWGTMYYGRPYWNAGAVKAGASRVMGFVERDFDQDLGIQVAYEGSGKVTPFNPRTLVRSLQILLSLRLSFKKRLAADKCFVAEATARIAELEQVDCEALADKELFALFERLIRVDYKRSETTYFTHIFDNTNLQTLFKQSLRRHKGAVDLLRLVIGLTDLSHLRPNFALWDVSRAIRHDDAARRFWETSSEAELVAAVSGGANDHSLDEVRAYLCKYRYHSIRELDITVPNYREDPSFVIANLRQLVDLGDDHDPRRFNERQAAQHEAERSKLLALTPPWSRRKVRRQLDEMRQFLWWREELRDFSTQLYDQIRRFALAVGERLVRRGRATAVDDVFFLPIDELISALHGDLTTDELTRRLATNRVYYESFRNFTNPADIGFAIVTEAPAATGETLVGIGCSPGVREGTARVILDIRDARRLHEGDILVTRFTDPGWTPVFGLIGGVVTQTGGVLSHAAVISREYGMPAVLAVSRATVEIPDGARVRVDGQTGRVTILERPERNHADVSTKPRGEAATETTHD